MLYFKFYIIPKLFTSFPRGKPLAPPEVLLGCHKTAGQPTKRYFSSGIYDEVAFWKKRLNDTEIPYFLGGYSKLNSSSVVKGCLFLLF